MDGLTSGIDPARLDALLADHGFGPQGPEALLLVDPRSAKVLWASPAARLCLTGHDAEALDRNLFTESASGRAYAARLKRLRGQAAFRLDRLVLPTRTVPVVVACYPVSVDVRHLALLHLRGLAMVPPQSASEEERPAAASPESGESSTSGVPAAPAEDLPPPVTRIAWEADADGRVTRLGPEVQRLGRLAPHLGDDLPGLLRPFAAAAADRLIEAATQSGAVGLLRLDWPSAMDKPPVLVELGYAARRGASGGLRGVFTVHGTIEDAVVEAAAPEHSAEEDRPEPETIPVAQAMEAMPDSVSPAVSDEEIITELAVTADATRAEADQSAVPHDEPGTQPSVAPAPELPPTEPARGNVVHFPLMRLGPVPANFGAPLRPPLLPDHAISDGTDLQTPQWSEAPPSARSPEAAEPEGLSADERDAFEHIRKVLGTRPFAQPLRPASPDPVLPVGLVDLLDGVPVAVRLELRGSSLMNRAWRERPDAESAIGAATTFDFAGTSATLTVLPPLQTNTPSPPDTSVSSVEILDLVGDGCLRLDETGMLRAVSPKAARLLGIEAGAALGRPFTNFLFDGQAASWQALAAAATGPEAQPQGPSALRLRNAAGQPVAVLARLARIDGALLCALTLDRPAASPANDTAEAARREAERTSALKSEFLAKVSHEIRTPLNAILGFAEVIRDERLGPVGNARYLEYMRDIHASGTHVMSLVNDLLDLSRIEAGRMDLNLEAVDANAIVQSCVNTLQTQAHRDRVIVRLSLTPRLPPTLADERSLRQIVLNLLSNAIKFNEPGGQVIVSTAKSGPHAIAIRIRDTGIGMSDDEIEAAMEPFRQISTVNRTGSGLGLPLTKALVEANCASMTIKSTRGEGTLVEVTFPLVEQDSVSLPAE